MRKLLSLCKKVIVYSRLIWEMSLDPDDNGLFTGREGSLSGLMRMEMTWGFVGTGSWTWEFMEDFYLMSLTTFCSSIMETPHKGTSPGRMRFLPALQRRWTEAGGSTTPLCFPVICLGVSDRIRDVLKAFVDNKKYGITSALSIKCYNNFMQR